MIKYENLEEISFPGKEGQKIYNLDFGSAKIPLYWSKQLSMDLKESILQNSLYLKKYNKIIKLIDQEIIYPCRFKKSYLKFLLNKAKVFFLGFSPIKTVSQEASAIGGFFAPEKNKIFLLIDNYSNIFNKQHIYNIELLIFHELSHYVAHNKKNTYFSKLYDKLLGFYFIFFSTLFQLNKDSLKEISMYVKKIITFEKSNSDDIKLPVKNLKDLILKLKPYSKLDDKSFDMLSKITLYYLVKILTGDSSGFSSNTFYQAYYILSTAFLHGYDYLHADLKYASTSLFYQEFLYPSEVPAIASTNPTNITTKKYISLL